MILDFENDEKILENGYLQNGLESEIVEILDKVPNEDFYLRAIMSAMLNNLCEENKDLFGVDPNGEYDEDVEYFEGETKNHFYEVTRGEDSTGYPFCKIHVWRFTVPPENEEFDYWHATGFCDIVTKEDSPDIRPTKHEYMNNQEEWDELGGELHLMTPDEFVFYYRELKEIFDKARAKQ